MSDYLDLDYFMARNEFSGINYREDAEAVKQSMVDILLTKLGERENMPLYGSKIYTLLMEKISDITAIMLKDEIKVALENWEPRIRLTNIEIEKHLDEQYYEVFIYFDLIRLSESNVLNLTLNRVS